MRGEQTNRSSTLTACLGSPPHARGTELVVDVSETAAGITPACAGNSDRTRVYVDGK